MGGRDGGREVGGGRGGGGGGEGRGERVSVRVGLVFNGTVYTSGGDDRWAEKVLRFFCMKKSHGKRRKIFFVIFQKNIMRIYGSFSN